MSRALKLYRNGFACEDREVSCDGYYRLSNQETTEQLETYFLSANQA